MADAKMMYIEDDIEKIQMKTNLYLKSYGPEGEFHLTKEVVQNSVDEVIDPESNGSDIVIICDKLEDSVVVEDDGRGIPEDDYPLDICCTKLQSGSKFMRDAGSDSAGELNS
jgi:DNA gyrase/topoisomerase IV subunit B